MLHNKSTNNVKASDSDKVQVKAGKNKKKKSFTHKIYMSNFFWGGESFTTPNFLLNFSIILKDCYFFSSKITEYSTHHKRDPGIWINYCKY